ncbi:MAG: hypothetical protein V1691_01845 [Chloroflexota bacterium]
MPFEGTAGNIIFVIVIVLLLALNIFMRKRRQEGSKLGMVSTIYSDVDKNGKLAESFSYHWQSARFRTAAWAKNREKVSFLPQDLMSTVSKVFDMADQFNQRLDAAKRSKSDSYLAGIELDKIKEPAAKARQGLREWFQANVNNPEYMPRKRGLFG